MAISSYLLQTVICNALFYRFGLHGRVGPAAGVLPMVAIHTPPLAISVCCLQPYRFGPSAWLCRTLSYCRRQRLRPEG